MDFESLMNRLDELGENSTKALEEGLRQAGRKVQGSAKRLTPVDTGRLRNSIIEYLEYKDGEIIENIGTNVKYAPYVEMGTGPIGEKSPKDLPPNIKPKYRKDGWVYYDELEGVYYYTKGQAPQPFLYPAFKENEKEIPNIIANVIKKKLLS